MKMLLFQLIHHIEAVFLTLRLWLRVKAQYAFEESDHRAKAEEDTCYEYGESCVFASVEICFACPKK